MIVESLELQNFRNYERALFSFDSGTNIFYGDNAQGKTNVLEALQVCATTKSQRGSHDTEMIGFGEEEAHLRLLFHKQGMPHKTIDPLEIDLLTGLAAVTEGFDGRAYVQSMEVGLAEFLWDLYRS